MLGIGLALSNVPIFPGMEGLQRIVFVADAESAFDMEWAAIWPTFLIGGLGAAAAGAELILAIQLNAMTAGCFSWIVIIIFIVALVIDAMEKKRRDWLHWLPFVLTIVSVLFSVATMGLPSHSCSAKRRTSILLAEFTTSLGQDRLDSLMANQYTSIQRPMTLSDSDFSRYARQMRYPPLGEDGQRRLSEATALICGCGALGSVLANTLARAGVGRLRIVDRDFLELNNLQRQVLYDEQDVADGLPKAIAAERRLRQINSSIEIEAIVADVSHENVLELAAGADVLLDGADNFEVRFLLNDVSHKLGVPWVYGGCIGAEGQTMTILPGETACLRCLHPDAPPPGSTPTCDSAGILGTIINVIASIEATEALKILSGRREAVSRQLTVIDLWDNRMRQVKLDKLREVVECPACLGEAFPWLEGERSSGAAVLCGRNSVQLTFPSRANIDLEALGDQLREAGEVSRNKYLLRFSTGDYRLTVFPDGRAIVSGTEDISEAKTLYAKYVGA